MAGLSAALESGCWLLATLSAMAFAWAGTIPRVDIMGLAGIAWMSSFAAASVIPWNRARNKWEAGARWLPIVGATAMAIGAAAAYVGQKLGDLFFQYELPGFMGPVAAILLIGGALSVWITTSPSRRLTAACGFLALVSLIGGGIGFGLANGEGPDRGVDGWIWVPWIAFTVLGAVSVDGLRPSVRRQEVAS